MAKFADIAAKLRAAASRSKVWVRTHARTTFYLTKLFFLWLKRVWLWVWEPYIVYIAVLAVALPVAASFYWPDEDVIRRAGLWLQLAGIGTVWWGIEKTRKLFRHPPFWQQARQRLRHRWHTFPPLRRRTIVEVGVAGATISGGRVRAFNWNAPSDDTVEQRLEAMEKNLTRVRDELATFQNKTDDEFAKQTKALKQEQKDRAEGDKEVSDLVTATETGGLHITMAGAIFLFLGVTMSTVPAELAGFLCQPVNGFLFQ